MGVSFSALFRSSSLGFYRPRLRMDLALDRPGFEPGCALTWVCDAVNAASPPSLNLPSPQCRINISGRSSLSCPFLPNFIDFIYKASAESGSWSSGLRRRWMYREKRGKRRVRGEGSFCHIWWHGKSWPCPHNGQERSDMEKNKWRENI